ncbi:MAG: rRNA maturation RNase YbeY [Candidatus Zixiibacteriota bacterium]|nr:MAG: rRNA maturation RNase YbeY [candidate division Zixibacteria bacterium]
MYVNIISSTNRKIPRKRIARMIEMIEEDEEPPDSTLNIILTRDRQLSRLNEQYRRRSGPTDVLSFVLDRTPGRDSVLGEIYISTDTAAKNADKYGVTFTAEILRLCCHGFLHLLGYDHVKKRDREIMFDKEETYLRRMRQC